MIPTTPNHQPFNIVPDIHGFAAPLRALLATLGYEEATGTYRHPEGRKVIFLGDWIDRGPAIPETLRIVRAMHAAGTALAVPGNHELNALAYATPDGNGGWLRARNRKHEEQHAATLAQFADCREEWEDHLAWFRTIPLWIELPGLRAVHAAWDARAVAALGEGARLGEALLRRACTEGTREFCAVETLLKGVEAHLPNGCGFFDNTGYRRQKIRCRWWLRAKGATLRALALQPGTNPEEIPALPADAYDHLVSAYQPHERPVFNGHYWLDGEPTLMAPNVAVLDYGVAKGRALVAYRWDGEQALDPSKFVWNEIGRISARGTFTKAGSPTDLSVMKNPNQSLPIGGAP
jgi:hypothetical protein